MRVEELGLERLDMGYARLRVRDRRGENRLMLSLEQHGQQSPICVVASAEPGRYVVIDGHKRVRALRRLKLDMVRVAVWEMAPAEALVTSYQMGSRGGWNALEEGWLAYELVRVQRWGLSAVAVKMDRSKSWVSRRLGLVESLPERVQELVQKGRIGAYAAAKHLLPLARANGGACERLAEKISEAALSSRQAAVLCEHYRARRGKAAERVLEDPARFLKVLEEAKKGRQDPALSEAENRCLNNFELIGNVSLSLVRRLPEVVGYDTSETAWSKLWDAWRRSRKHFGLLETAVAGLAKTQDRN